MTSLSFPDTNVWVALAYRDHVHRGRALAWWNGDNSVAIGFCRLTQLGLLRMITTERVMNGQPLTMPEAWVAYDRFFVDRRVAFWAEPDDLQGEFRKQASLKSASPKVWADAYLVAFARLI